MDDGPGMAVARAAIYTHDAADLKDLDRAGLLGSAVAAIVDVDGPVEALVHLPAAYLDEILLRDRRRDAEKRIQRLRHRFAGALAELGSGTDSALGPVNLFTSIENLEPFARIATTLDGSFRANTKCRPRLRLGDVLEAGFWAYWNWLCVQLEERPEELRSLLVNFSYQFEFYDEHGLRMKHLGEAVRHAAFQGAGERPAHKKLAAAIDPVHELANEGTKDRDWYDRATQNVSAVARITGLEQKVVAQLFAIYSQAADTTATVGLVKKAIDQFREFGEIYAGRFPESQSAEAEAVMRGEAWEGRKRSSFCANIIEPIDP